MKERPILFSGPMVRAILDGRKTQTRRVIKPQPMLEETEYAADILHVQHNPPFGIGQKLWIRETWGVSAQIGDIFNIRYKADGLTKDLRVRDWDGKLFAQLDKAMRQGWRPSIFMPKEAARIWLEITDIRVERVQDIGMREILAEGVDGDHRQGVAKSAEQLRASFARLWDSINVKRGYSWESNPFVWVIEFRRIG